MGFLDNYEDVNSRIKRFRAEHPTGRLVAFIEDINLDKGTILIRAEAYREYEDSVPSAVDYAYGNVASLAHNMKRWLVEDTVTSAYGRVIGLLSPSEGGRPTRQDMEQVEAAKPSADPWSVTAATTDIPTMASAMGEIEQSLGGEQVAAAPRCPHGSMIWATGEAKATGKPWAAYKCTEKNRASQCQPIWHVRTSSGTWKPQV